MKRKTQRIGMAGLCAALVFALALTACPTGGGGGGGDEYITPTPPTPTPQTVEYRSEDDDGNTYRLTITETLSGAKYAAKQGDKYVLTVTLVGPPAETRTSSGTVVSGVGATITLSPSKGSGTITVTVSGGDLTGITIASTVKDDADVPLSTGNTLITLKPVPGGDVYITGYDDDKPCYWIDGVQQFLPITGSSGWAGGIALSGSNIYIAGISFDNGGNVQPCYWLNDTKYSLSVTGSAGSAESIAVSGSNVYIVGDETTGGNTQPCYWLNGAQTMLPYTGAAGSGGFAEDIALR